MLCTDGNAVRVLYCANTYHDTGTRVYNSHLKDPYVWATYWKSQPRKFCDFCKCWITDNKPSVDFHEKGKNHQANVKRKIDEVKKKGVEDAKKKQEMADDMQKMEKAALEAFKKDLANNPALAAKYGVNIRSEKVKEEEQRKETEAACSETNKDEDEWLEAVAENGYHYFWNTKTGESVWEAPDKYVSLEAQKAKNISKSSLSKDKLPRKLHSEKEEDNESCEEEWYEAVSDNGHHYYWNTKTEESVWVAPKKYFSLEDQKKISKEQTTVEEDKQETQEEDDEVLEGLKFGPQPRQPRHTAYGFWETVKEHSPERMLDLPPFPDTVESIPLPEPPVEEKPKFKEKRVTSLGEGLNVAFKKRKLGSGARNVRQRDEYD